MICKIGYLVKNLDVSPGRMRVTVRYNFKNDGDSCRVLTRSIHVDGFSCIILMLFEREYN